MSSLDEELVSELVHCVEEVDRSWRRLYELAQARDRYYGFCIFETHWKEWIYHIQRLVKIMCENPSNLDNKDCELWAQMLSALPESVADADIDEVTYPIYVHKRLKEFWRAHVPSRPQEYEIG